MAKSQQVKMKIADLALELAMQTKDVINKAAEIGIIIKSTSSSISDKEAQILYDYIINSIVPQKDEPRESKPKATKSAKTTKTTKASAESSKKKASSKKPKESKEAKEKEPSTTKAKSAKKKKEETPPVETAKTLDSKEADSKSNIDTTMIKQPEKRKIIIVSRNSKSAKQDPIEKPVQPTIKEILSLKEPLPPKPKKEKKPHRAVSHKGSTQKIDINRNLGDTNVDDDNDVMLFDINEIENGNVVEEEKEEKIIDRLRIQRSNSWFFNNISRDRKKRKGKGGSKDSSRSGAHVKEGASDSSIKIPDEIRVYEFADKVGLRVTDIIGKLFKMGEMVTKNDFLDATMIEILSQEFNLSVEISKATQELEYLELLENVSQELSTRAPVVTIMGHVDHGKTSLLDYIRNSRVSKTESGGITQHIGAYMVEKNGKNIAFIDTPGHEAFTAMRSRGAKVTDIAVIVIAADDGVKEQTKEALAHVKDSNVQIVIAMNKMDKENANPDKLKAEMAEIGYNPSDWGGEYDFIPVSAKTGAGVDELLDTILLQAEIMDLKANMASKPKAVILEGSLDKGKGPVVTAIVQEGILKVGDSVVAGTAYGKVRALIKDDGSKVNALYPSEVALLTGLSEVPSAGAILVGVDDESVAKEYALKRKSYLRSKELSKSTKVSIDELSMVVETARLKPLLLIIKADTQGSLEAIKLSLETLSNEEVKINIIASSVGNITENDISIAQSNDDCYILGFNVKPLGILKAKAKEANVSIKSYSVIYHLIDDVKAIIASMMSPLIEEEIVGNLEVRDIFNVGKGGVIAGCYVLDGIVRRDSKVRLIRKSKVVYEGGIASLKRFKDDAKEVAKGYECGIMLDSFNDIMVGDSMEILKEVQKLQQI